MGSDEWTGVPRCGTPQPSSGPGDGSAEVSCEEKEKNQQLSQGTPADEEELEGAAAIDGYFRNLDGQTSGKSSLAGGDAIDTSSLMA